jgi:hypothetical protein
LLNWLDIACKAEHGKKKIEKWVIAYRHGWKKSWGMSLEGCHETITRYTSTRCDVAAANDDGEVESKLNLLNCWYKFKCLADIVCRWVYMTFHTCMQSAYNMHGNTTISLLTWQITGEHFTECLIN